MSPQPLRDMVKRWVTDRLTGHDVAYSLDQFEIDVVDRLNLVRRSSSLPTFRLDTELEQWLRSRSTALNLDDIQAVVDLIQAEQPRYFQVHARSAEANNLRELANLFQDAAKDSGPLCEHLAVLVREQRGAFGFEALVVVGQRLDDFTPAALNTHKTDTFFSTCPHCNKPHACKISMAQRGLSLDCPSCKRDYGVLSPDTQGHYHWVSDFLTGYQPPTHYMPHNTDRTLEMFSIWTHVVQSCSYQKDNSPGMPNRDAWQTSLETMVRGRGDCEDSSILLADWLISRGFEARVAIGRYGDVGQHAWCVVRVEGVDYLLESTEGNPDPDKLPYVADVGARYVPETLFDREFIYVRSDRRERFQNNYWSNKEWIKLDPKTIGQPQRGHGKNTMAQQASQPRSVSSAAKPQRRESLSLPMPPFARLKAIPESSSTWQVPSSTGASSKGKD
jgi:hypothetical protein